MSLEPLVTVVVRSHQRTRLPLLQRALFSIWSQDLPECLEILLVSANYAETFDSRLCTAYLGEAATRYHCVAPRLFRHFDFKLTGDSRARLLNAGLREARGQYLCFLDDDDILRENALRRLIDKARDTDSDLVFGRVDLVVIDLAQKRIVVPYSTRPINLLALLQHNTAPLCSFLFKRPAAHALPQVSETLNSHEDYALLLQLLTTAKMAELNDSHAVAEYWLTLGGKSQAEKYAQHLAADMSAIFELKQQLRFTLSGQALTETALEPMQAQVNADLLNALSIDNSAITARIEQTLETRFGTLYLGWAIPQTLNQRHNPPHLFAVTQQGLAYLVTTRLQRVDFVALRNMSHENWGFAYLTQESLSHFVAVSAHKKIIISL